MQVSDDIWLGLTTAPQGKMVQSYNELVAQSLQA